MTVGVEIDAGNIKVGIVEDGIIYKKYALPYSANESKEVITSHLIQTIKVLFNSNIRSIGVGVSAFVDSTYGIVYNSRNISSWREVHLKDILESEFRVPVKINNNSNCFVFGERYYGECTAFRSVVGVIMGIGLGAGIIINDKLYEGYRTSAGEIGSLSYLDMDYESYCAGNFFIRHNTTAKIAIEAAKDGDDTALELWETFGIHVGNLMKTILYTYDPQAVILGGEISQAYKFFSAKMHEEITNFPFKRTVSTFKVLVSQKEDIGLLGAAALI